MKPIIVGIDPGTTAAFAVLDFYNNILSVFFQKHFSLSEMIKKVIKYGNPLIIGTDKKEIPRFIKNFTARTGAKIVTLCYDLKKDEKRRIALKHHKIRYNNNHETANHI